MYRTLILAQLFCASLVSGQTEEILIKDGDEDYGMTIHYNKFNKPDTVFIQIQRQSLLHQVYGYDTNGNKIFLSQPDNRHRLIKKFEYRYNLRNQLVKETRLDIASYQVTNYRY